MRDTIDMAREAGADIGTSGRWLMTQAELDRLVALVRADERNRTWTQEHWTDYERNIAATEREACAKLIESRKTGANELMDAVRDMEARAIRARSAGEPRTPADTAEIEEIKEENQRCYAARGQA